MAEQEEVALPEMICFSDFNDWTPFIENVFNVFKADFMDRKPNFRGMKMQLKYHPKVDDKPCTFYHMTHEGEDEQNRTPELRRSERMPWAFPVIENGDNWRLKIWPQVRKNKHRLCIWLELEGEPDYFVVLDIRENYVLPWTAFVAEYNHQKEKKLREYRAYLSTLS